MSCISLFTLFYNEMMHLPHMEEDDVKFKVTAIAGKK